ncbi:MAG: hypothetical protein HN432_11995 [Gammaproteobacteria bacterium]|nr:hypothetical protein [Gammaproteobacteria bacterium]
MAEDAFESDDEQTDARLIIVGDPVAQIHDLDLFGDVDWVRFYAVEDEVYEIQTSDVGADIDLVIEVYDAAGTLIRERVDNFFSGEAEQLSFKADYNGPVYLKLFDPFRTQGGGETNYSLNVFVPTGAAAGVDLGITQALVENVSAGNVGNLTLTVRNLGGQSEDNTATNVLVQTFLPLDLDAPTLPAQCSNLNMLVSCEFASLAESDVLTLEFGYQFTSEGSYTFVSSVSAYEDEARTLQQPDETYTNNIAEGFIEVSASGGGTDSDLDGVLDTVDNCVAVANADQADFDEDGAGDACDDDDDNDGVLDSQDAFPLDAGESVDTDADGTGNNADSDDDGDGVADADDAFPLDAAESVDTDNDGTGNNADNDDDGDGVDDTDDAFPLDPTRSAGDSDGDGFADNVDNCAALANADQADFDEDGAGDACDADDDNDGVLDSQDAFPLDAGESVDTDGDGTGNNADTDDDGDGVPDTDDAFPLDPTRSAGDSDGDGFADNVDNCAVLANADQADFDEDGAGDACDDDDDNDGVADAADAFPFDPSRSQVAVDSDNDGTDDEFDLFPMDARGALDNDLDNMADEWELLFGLDPDDAGDAFSDLDHDGMTALEEFIQDSDPTVSNLKEFTIRAEGASFLLPGQSNQVSIMLDATANSAGLAIRIHYNSAEIASLELSDVFASQLISNQFLPFDDVSDFDDNSSTDLYVLINWQSNLEDWPGSATVMLCNLNIELVNGQDLGHLVNIDFSVESVTDGFEVQFSRLQLPVQNLSLDIDGDGEVKALSDGLMIMRYLFGFRGDSLIAGAVGEEASRTTSAEIEAAIAVLIP